MSIPPFRRSADAPAGDPHVLVRAPRFRDAAVVALALAPAVAAIWLVPWFVTQDGPAHLYNAAILVDSLRGGPAFGRFYEVRWDPLPNWGGHLTQMALVAAFPPRVADLLMTTITLLAVALAAAWLRGRTADGRPSAAARALAALAAISFSWLMGFASFQLGAALFAITLGVWWKHRDDLRPGRMAALSALLVAGYFCHLVSLGLTAFAMGFLALASPGAGGPRSWRDRIGKLAACAAPVAALLLVYLRLARRGGAMTPVLPTPGEFLTLAGWAHRLGWADPLSLAIKDVLPFDGRRGPGFLALAPIAWLAAAGLLLTLDALRPGGGSGRETGERRAWLGLSSVLFLGAIFGPDSMGPNHGDYLPQRVALLGLIAALPAIGPASGSLLGRLGAGAMVAALALQTAAVWDYGLFSSRTAGRIAAAAPMVGEGRRVATLLAEAGTRFRVNPALHADCWLGVAGGNVVWSNYETRHYYFPVHFREGLPHPDPYDLQEIALLGTAPETAERRREWWERVLTEHHDAIDVLLVWREDPTLDAVTARWFEPSVRRGEVRIFRPREAR